jgi:NTE family protein
MLREIWLSREAREVFRGHPLSLVLTRLRGSLAALPGDNIGRLIERATQLSGIRSFADLRLPVQVVVTDINAGKPKVFDEGLLAPALLASTAVPALFPAVKLDGRTYMDGGIVDNMPLSLAVEGGAREVLGIELMAGAELEGGPAGFNELIARTLQLSLHHRMLLDFERLKSRARVVVLCPVLETRAGMEMRRERVASVIEGARSATLTLLREQGRRLFARSGIHHLEVPSPSAR